MSHVQFLLIIIILLYYLTFLPSGLGVCIYKKKYFYFLINYSLRIIINLPYKHIRSLFILQVKILYIILLKKRKLASKQKNNVWIWSKTFCAQFNQNPNEALPLLNIAINTAWKRNWFRPCSLHFKLCFPKIDNHFQNWYKNALACSEFVRE